ncbi:MAG: hypothetical protein DI586_09930 [Micavibrio aeruginosavorus]|uniref:SET domain-containing protein n=1 Tax=Micavibrio aeruginosavorus TaxID=349221 RepID=A0A2W5FGM8_9BACT|nr:MAG: hypothetical protein DI586_09930 [Micavibrio aeruginosavorus]
MKSSAAKKVVNWHQNVAANTPETILGASIAWRKISDDKGRGVFALRNIKKGEVIEVSPVVPVAKKDIKHNGSAPDGYLLEWDEDTKGEEYCMPLGYIMLYNHSKKPTMHLDSDLENYVMTASALRDIKVGEELTWDYSCEIWFDEA